MMNTSTETFDENIPLSEMDAQIYSDIHKDLYGIRYRGGEIKTYRDLRFLSERLEAELNEEHEREKEEERKKFETTRRIVLEAGNALGMKFFGASDMRNTLKESRDPVLRPKLMEYIARLP